YMDALVQHIRKKASAFRDKTIETVYFGGGTPSLAGAKNLVRVLDTVRDSFALSANAEITTEANPGDIYLTQLENPIPVIGYGLKKASEKGMFVILNPAPANREIEPYIQYCNLLTPNESETQLFGGKAALLEKIDNLLITLGGDGYEISNKEQSNKYPCIKITPVDTTAAGDTLCGGLTVGLSEGKSLADSARLGSIAASIACTRYGAQPSIPQRAEVDEYFNK
ncbi:MAG: hypothetical protein IKT32_05700, partial [Clostridia bacterium]|nr:hypothetical protein [Clostridia bacterium]